MEFYDDIDQDMSIKEYTTVKCKFLKIDDNLVIKGTPCKVIQR